MEFCLSDEVAWCIRDYIPRDKDQLSPTSILMKDFIDVVGDLTAHHPEFEVLPGYSVDDRSFASKAFDVIQIMEEYGLRSDLSNLCLELPRNVIRPYQPDK